MAQSDFVMNTGGGPLPAPLFSELRALVTPRLIVSYASTECFPLMTHAPEEVADLGWYSLFPDRVVEIVGEEDARSSTHEIGSIADNERSIAQSCGSIRHSDRSIAQRCGSIRHSD